MTAEFGPVVRAPFVRRRVIGRVRSLLERYDALLAGPDSAVRIPILFRFPSGLRERDAVGRTVLESRRAAVEAEIRALKAAAPIPAPVDRPDRLRMQAFAEAQWIARELRALRRAARGRSPTVAVELYLETRPQDPLPEPERLLDPLRQAGRSRLVNLAFELAGVRYGVADLGRWLVEPPPGAGPGPVSAGRVDDLPEGRGRRIVVRDRPVAVFRLGADVVAVGATCPHRGGALDEGEVDEGRVVCPLHEWAFDLRTGRMSGRPTVCVPTYRVQIEDGEIIVHPPGETER